MKTKEAKIEDYIMKSFNNKWASKNSPLSITVASRELKIPFDDIALWASRHGGFTQRENFLFASDDVFKLAKKYEQDRIKQKRFEEHDDIVLKQDFSINGFIKISKGSNVIFLEMDKSCNKWAWVDFNGFSLRVPLDDLEIK